MYSELAKRSWIHTLGGGLSRLYTRSMSESDSKTIESERHGSLDKNKKETGRERFTEGLRDAREDDLRFQSNTKVLSLQCM
jgi:hypothetical protein